MALMLCSYHTVSSTCILTSPYKERGRGHVTNTGRKITFCIDYWQKLLEHVRYISENERQYRSTGFPQEMSIFVNFYSSFINLQQFSWFYSNSHDLAKVCKYNQWNYLFGGTGATGAPAVGTHTQPDATVLAYQLNSLFRFINQFCFPSLIHFRWSSFDFHHPELWQHTYLASSPTRKQGYSLKLISEALLSCAIWRIRKKSSIWGMGVQIGTSPRRSDHSTGWFTLYYQGSHE